MHKSVGYPGRHKCEWVLGDLHLVVAFGAGRKPAADRALPAAGRPTVTDPVKLPERSYCTVATGHIPFTEMPGVADQVELASVFVNMPPGQSGTACTAAHAAAELLWPKLPVGGALDDLLLHSARHRPAQPGDVIPWVADPAVCTMDDMDSAR